MQEVKIKELNVTNVGAWVNYCAEPLTGLEHKIKVISIFTGKVPSFIEEWDVSSISEVYNVIINKLSKLNKDLEPLGVVKIDGKTFRFNKDLTKLKASKVFDIKALGEQLPNNYAYVLAIMYDCDEEITMKDKERLFIEHFPAQEFISFLGFFLGGYELLSLVSLEIQRAIIKEEIAQEKLVQATLSQTTFTRWRNALIRMWIQLQTSIILLFYFGKNFSFKSRN
jgi:hypothetical protein